MPKIRARSRPLTTCLREGCNMSFRQWRRRLYCSDRCRKEEWRARHSEYYAQIKREQRKQEKAKRRRDLKYRWVVEGEENKAPERLTLVEAVAQASPQALEEIRELLPDYKEGTND